MTYAPLLCFPRLKFVKFSIHVTYIIRACFRFLFLFLFPIHVCNIYSKYAHRKTRMNTRGKRLIDKVKWRRLNMNCQESYSTASTVLRINLFTHMSNLTSILTLDDSYTKNLSLPYVGRARAPYLTTSSGRASSRAHPRLCICMRARVSVHEKSGGRIKRIIYVEFDKFQPKTLMEWKLPSCHRRVLNSWRPISREIISVVRTLKVTVCIYLYRYVNLDWILVRIDCRQRYYSKRETHIERTQ